MADRATRYELECYDRDGYFVRESAFPSSDLIEIRAAVERVNDLIQAAADSSGEAIEWIEGKRYERVLGSSVKWDWDQDSRGVRSMEPFHHLDPRLEKLMEDPRLTGPMPNLVGEEAVGLFTDKLNPKRPGGAPFPWHQDGPYWQFGCSHVDRLVSVGLYLCDTTEEGACLSVFPGTHRFGKLPAPKGGGRLEQLYTDVSLLEGEPVAVEVPAGSLLFFHPDIVHGAPSNLTDEPKPALYVTYQPAGFPTWTPP
jgi:hypothetical protein